MVKTYKLDPKYEALTLTKAGQKQMELIAKSRLQTLVITQVIPDYLYNRIRLDTGRLRSTIRAEPPDTYKKSAKDFGVEVEIAIGGIEAASQYKSRYGNIYGKENNTVGAYKLVNYAAWLAKRGILSDFEDDLFGNLKQFIDRTL